MSLVEDDPDYRPMEIEFILGQTFYYRERFNDALKEFAIVKNFELEIETDSQTGQVMVRGRYENCTWRVIASIDKRAKSFTIRFFCNEHSCDILGAKK